MAEQQSNVAVLGGGSFGTALASIAADNGANVRQWLRDEALVAQINREHRNGRYLPDYAINPAVTASTDLKSVLTGAELVLIAIPSKAFSKLPFMAATLESSALVKVSVLEPMFPSLLSMVASKVP